MPQRASPDVQLAFDLLAEDLEKRLIDVLKRWEAIPRYKTTDAFRAAIACRDWRELRLGLLGQTLEAKYLRLSDWVNEGGLGGSSDAQRAAQVLNYVETLRRQGVLHVADKTDTRRI